MAFIGRLIESSADGGIIIDKTNELIQNINSQVDQLSETNQIINQIASQPNQPSSMPGRKLLIRIE